jgi:hypothetical protein
MPHISVLPPNEASKESNAVYDEFYRRMQFPAPPNFIMTQGHSSSVARGTWELVKNVLVSGHIERWKKEMIFVAISKERNCHYCLAAHIACRRHHLCHCCCSSFAAPLHELARSYRNLVSAHLD